MGRELVVAFIMGRHRHDRAGAVFDQYEIGNPNGQGLAGEGVDHGQSRIHALLFGLGHIGFGGFHFPAFVDKCGDFRIVFGGF